MKNARQNSLSKNALFGVLAWILPLGLSFVATPLILKKLGAAEFGVYTLILGFISYSFVFNIGRSVTKLVAEYKSAGETEKIAEVLTTVVALSAALSLTAIVVMTVGANWFVGEVLQIEPDLRAAAAAAFYIAGFIIAATIFSQIFLGILQAFQRFDIYSLILVLTNSVSTLGNILIVYEGGKTSHLMIWNALSTAVTAGVFLYFSAGLLKGVKLSWRISREVARAVLKFNSAIFLMQIFGNLILLFERSLITAKFGAEALTYYVIPMNLSLLIQAFVGSFIIVIFPRASESKDAGDRESLRLLYQKATKLVVALTVFWAVTLIVCRNSVLTNYIGAELAQRSGEILIFHTLTFSLAAVSTVFWQFIEGFGEPQVTTLIVFVWLIVSVPLMMIFSRQYSLESISVARLIGGLIVIPAILYSERKIFGRVLWAFWGKILITLSVAGGAVLIAERNLIEYFPLKIPGLLLTAFSGGVLYAAVLLIAGFFDDGEKKWLTELVGRLLK